MKRSSKLTHQEKMEIYNKYNSGNYYKKELCNEFHISKWTLEKVVKEIKNLIRKKLYGTEEPNNRA